MICFSPYNFILCMKYLTHLIQNEVELSNWKGIKTSRDNSPSLIFSSRMTSSFSLKPQSTLGKLCSISGQKINYTKSKIYFSPHTSPYRIMDVERELCINPCRDFSKYLGVLILTDKRSNRAYSFIIDKLCSRLAKWKANSFSLAGHTTFINVVTASIPTHVMQCTMLLTNVCKETDKINRSFL